MEDFVDEVRLSQSLIELSQVFNLSIHLLVLLKLCRELTLVVIDLLPDSIFLRQNLLFGYLKILQLLFLLLFILLNLSKLAVQFFLLPLERLELPQKILIWFTSRLLDLPFDLLELLLVPVPLLLLALDLGVQLTEYLVKALETNRVLQLDVVLTSEVLDSQGQVDLVARVGELLLRLTKEYRILVHDVFRAIFLRQGIALILHQAKLHFELILRLLDGLGQEQMLDLQWLIALLAA